MNALHIGEKSKETQRHGHGADKPWTIIKKNLGFKPTILASPRGATLNSELRNTASCSPSSQGDTEPHTCFLTYIKSFSWFVSNIVPCIKVYKQFFAIYHFVVELSNYKHLSCIYQFHQGTDHFFT